MSAPRYRSTVRQASVARATRAPLFAAAAALLGASYSLPAAAQDVAYCDAAVAEQTLKLQKNGEAAFISSGQRKKQGIRLTEEKSNQRSTVFHDVPLAFPPGTSLHQHFRVRIAGGIQNLPPNGADGLSFILQNDPGGDPLMVGKVGTGSTALGAGGVGHGYGGITQSLALELDTLQNDMEMDPDGNHIALLLGGYVSHTEEGMPMGKPLAPQPEGSTVAPFQPVQIDPAMKSFESTQITSADTRDVWIDYECAAPNSCSMKVYMTFNNAALDSQFADPTDPTTLPKKPDMPSMVVDGLQDIGAYLNGLTGFVGFSASTGAAMDEHLVTFWLSSRKPLVDSDMNNLEDACECKNVPTACDGNVPICDSGTGQGFCRDCMNDGECNDKDPARPLCDAVLNGGSGACVECKTDMDCAADKPFCDTLQKTCTASCSTDAQCDAKKWCDNPSGVPFQGKCADDLPNGAPIPTSENHMPALDGTCNPEVAAVVCVSGVCDEAKDTCGLPPGGPCTMENAGEVCQSGVCLPEGTCGCAKDIDCGEAASGKVCNTTTSMCVDGCRGADGNGCPTGLECSSTTNAVGECRTPGTGPIPEGGIGSVEGSGLFSCGTARRGASGDPAALIFLAALAGGLVRRRRR